MCVDVEKTKHEAKIVLELQAIVALRKIQG